MLVLIAKSENDRYLGIIFKNSISLKLNDYFLIAKIIVNDYNFAVANEQP